MQSKKELIGKIAKLIFLGVDRGTGDTTYTSAWCSAAASGENFPKEMLDPQEPTPFPCFGWREMLEDMPYKTVESLLETLRKHEAATESEEFEALQEYVFAVYARESDARNIILPCGSEMAGMARVEGGWKVRNMLFVPSRLPLAMLREIASIYEAAYPETKKAPPVKEIHLPEAKGAHEARPYGFFRALAGKDAISFMKKCVTDTLAPYEGNWECVGISPNGNNGFIAHVKEGKGLLHEIKVTV